MQCPQKASDGMELAGEKDVKAMRNMHDHIARPI